MRSAPTQRREDDRASGSGRPVRSRSAASPGRGSRRRSTMRPARDAERVVLDAPRLDVPERRGPRPGSAPAMPLTAPSMTWTSNHQSAARDQAADADEEQVVEVVEVPLVERAEVERPDPVGQALDELGRGSAPGPAAVPRKPNRRAARRPCRGPPRPRWRGSGTPSMPNSWNGSCCGAPKRLLGAGGTPAPATGRCGPSPNGRPRTMPEHDRRDGQQDERHGHRGRRFVDAAAPRAGPRGSAP